MDGISLITAKIEPLLGKPACLTIGSTFTVLQEQFIATTFNILCSVKLGQARKYEKSIHSTEVCDLHFASESIFYIGSNILANKAQIKFKSLMNQIADTIHLPVWPYLSIMGNGIVLSNSASILPDIQRLNIRFWNISDIHAPGKVVKL